jgi:formylglycine-generating enzyme required for sulfatase activity
LRSCTLCPETEEGNIYPELGHDFPVSWSLRTFATCTTQGLEERICQRPDCDDRANTGTLTQDINIDPNAHNFIDNWTETRAATTCIAGLEERTCASGCGLAGSIQTRPIFPVHVFVSGICTQPQCFMIEMADIPAGSFVRNTHTITLSAFRMSKFQVTQELYQAVMGNNPSLFSSNPADGEIQGKRPVETVNWYHAIVFCNRLSLREGLTPAYEMQTEADTSEWSSNPDTWGTLPTSSNARWNNVQVVDGSTGYRLPTEAQWEYACRAGSTTLWHFGDTESELVNYAWYSVNSLSRTRQVGLKLPNAWGLHDMHGNVWEWCWDWWGTFPNPADLEDPRGPASGVLRVERGGSWDSSASYTESAIRSSNWPHYRDSNLGFRFVRP